VLFQQLIDLSEMPHFNEIGELRKLTLRRNFIT